MYGWCTPLSAPFFPPQADLPTTPPRAVLPLLPRHAAGACCAEWGPNGITKLYVPRKGPVSRLPCFPGARGCQGTAGSTHRRQTKRVLPRRARILPPRRHERCSHPLLPRHAAGTCCAEWGPNGITKLHVPRKVQFSRSPCFPRARWCQDRAGRTHRRPPKRVIFHRFSSGAVVS